MKLDHIELERLFVSGLNVRNNAIGELESLASSIRKLGLLQPLLVRQEGSKFAVIAGQRRLMALQINQKDHGEVPPIPCVLMEEGDDAAAIEASLAENIERLPMDELDQYEAFSALVSKGRTPEDIASQFGITERLVRQRLAIANLDHRILALYRKEEINGETMRSLTMATKAQQKAWLKLYRDPQAHVPMGRNLRSWLLGGVQIKTDAAIFPLGDFKGAIVADLFGEDSYFGDPAAFWQLQRSALDGRKESYLERGWEDVVELEGENHFPTYDFVKTPKAKRGKVYVVVASDGTISFHEGYLPKKEVQAMEKRKAKGEEAPAASSKPELTKAAENYVALHRHAAVQGALLGASETVMRLLAAHLIAGSPLWNVRPDSLRAEKPETSVSRANSPALVRFEEERTRLMKRLDLWGEDDDGLPETMIQGSLHAPSIEETYRAVTRLAYDDVFMIVTICMAESLWVSSSALMDVLGSELAIDMSQVWTPDDAFLDLVTGKPALLSILKEVGGPVTAQAHKDSTGKVIRGVIRQYLTGEGREKVSGWVPPYMMFPAGRYLGESDEASAQAA